MKINKYLINLLILIIILTHANNFSYCKSEDSKEKVIYLTFDDGPDKIVTSKILDILKDKNAKGTFFLIGKLVELEPELTKRIYEEGHSIGLHSFSHDRAKVYKDNLSFLNEMFKTQEIIFNITNEKINILRFPFGTNNISYKINQSMVDLLHDNNFKIYDWNIDSGDGISPNSSPNKIFEKCKSIKNNSVILLHCGAININTSKALPLILDFFEKQGYTFKGIDENTKEIYNIKN